MIRYFVAAVLAAQLTVIFARSNGMIPLSACESMQPGHDGLPQTSESPYYLVAESAYFVRNIFLKVHLLTEEDAAPPFKGFYCQARTASNAIVGEFHIDASASHFQGHYCDSSQGVYDAISHSSSWSQNPGREVMLRWRVTTPLQENVRIRCTFVQNYTTYWVGVESQEIGPIKDATYEECCDEEGISSQCRPLCKNITEPATDEAFQILNYVMFGDYTYEYHLDYEYQDNATCYYEDVRLALRCSYWSQPGFKLNSSVVRDCCGDEIIDECKVFCNKNLYAAVTYTNYTGCLNAYPQLIYCVLQPVQGYNSSEYTDSSIDATEETASGTTSDPHSSFDTTTDEYTTTSSTTDGYDTTVLSTVTSSPANEYTTAGRSTATSSTTDEYSTAAGSSDVSSATIPPGTPSELPGRAVFTIITTIQVDGAMQNRTLRENVFDALENDLLIPALAKVQGYVTVRTGVNYYQGSLVVTSEGVYQQRSDGSVPTTDDIKAELDKRLQDINYTIREKQNAWEVSQPVSVSHKAVNQQCESDSCDDGTTCVEVGPDRTTCVCESDSCNNANETGLSTGAVVGIIVGVILLLVIVAVVLFYLLRRQRSLKATKRDKTHRASTATSNHSYEDPVYMDISSVQPEPPKLPPDRTIGTLPSNSVTYEMPTDEISGAQVQSFRKISEGYVVGVMEESTENRAKIAGEYGYATYDIKESTAENETYSGYDDHHIKTASIEENPANNHNVARHESESPDRDEKSANKQNVAGYESLSGYEYVDPVRS